MEYYSDGLNSFKFLKVLLQIIPKLTDISWKEPLILIDEPEIGLHTSFIYELVKTMNDNITENYTKIEKMDSSICVNDRYRLTINEVKCYFANAIVAVEGASDIRVLTNSNIRKLFPKLNKIEFYRMDSNNTNLKFISPTKRKHSIPTLFIVDMDKIISPDQNHKDIDEQVKYSLYKD